MRWDIFCAVIGCANLVIWLGVAHMLGRRIDLAHKRLDEGDEHRVRVLGCLESVASNHLTLVNGLASRSSPEPSAVPKEEP